MYEADVAFYTRSRINAFSKGSAKSQGNVNAVSAITWNRGLRSKRIGHIFDWKLL